MQSSTVFAWDFVVGYKRLLPRLGVSEQEYERESGGNFDIKPVVNNTVLGQSLLLAIKFETISVELEQSEYKYDSTIPATHAAVSEETDIECNTVENRLGITYNIERELAGIYAGVGLSSAKETLKSSSDKWEYQGISPFFKFGIDLILGSLIARYEQIHSSVGNHTVRVNSIGLLLAF